MTIEGGWYYTPQAAKADVDMQVRAGIGVLVAMTTLTLLAAQDAIEKIIAAVKEAVNRAVGFDLIV